MAPSTTSEKITLTYPLYCADFLDADHLVVGGGGGEGRSGVGNKITLLDVSKSSLTQSQSTTQIKQLVEHDLARDEDSCMSLAIARPPARQTKKSKNAPSPKILAGINSSEQQQLKGKNEHFRVFSISPSTIEPKSKHQLFTPSSRTDIYQRVLRARGPLAAVASGVSGKTGFEIVVVSSTDFTVKRRITTESEVGDLDLAEDGSLVYCTDKEIFTTSTTTSGSPPAPKKLNFQPSSPIPGKLRSLRYLTPNHERLVAVINAPQRSGAAVLLLDATTGSITAQTKLHRDIGAVTSLDVVSLASSGGAVAVAGADASVELLVVDGAKIRRVQLFRNVHPHQITKVAFSPAPAPPPPTSAQVEEENPHVIRLASTSIGNTVVVHTLPLVTTKGGYSLLCASRTAMSVLLSLIAVVIFAALLQVVFVTRGGLMVNDFLPGMHIERPVGNGGVEADVDALIEGMKRRSL
ncbi:hypothetical protein K440DRAFT_421955 [Wilcoxina mikolae CBS 423.85]|nr:hypothetical protein K440DRAFT_421955 [Wilcoxina mikolae CBS 423.85]